MKLFNVRHSVSGCLLALCMAIPALHAAESSFTLEVRTLTPLQSQHRGDREIQAELTRPLIANREVLMPTHSRLFGVMREVHSVGVGLRRERASVEIQFTSWETPDGIREPLDATPLSVDNAREQVDGRGRIQGILAASNPLGISRGLWLRPTTRLLRTPAGFGGATWLHVAMGPIGTGGMLGARMLLTRLPNPEIDLPAGTEMTLQVHCAAVGRSWATQANSATVEPELAEFLRQQSTTILKADQSPVADIINVALQGSEQDLLAAFEAAGWSSTDQLTRKSFAQTYRAFTQRQGYAEAPVSKLYYQDRLPDLVFQKSLNSIAKRHHVRLWKVTGPAGEELWLGAATHDVTVGFNSKNFGLLHKIDENVDRERRKVTGDLSFAGAVFASTNLARKLDLGEDTQSDGALGFVVLQSPTYQPEVFAHMETPKPSKLRRFARRLILEGRQYLLRDNPYYLAFATGRKLLRNSKSTLLDAWQEIESLPQAIAPGVLPVAPAE